ncbi:MAG: WYL domain-containing protein [Salinivirgaceae bacterium]|nr:WYL domain-containing protein [Salinivirgaceae bacterium]
MANNDKGQNLINKYVWLIDTILRWGKISYKKLNNEWVGTDFSHGANLPKRTLNNWRDGIADMFGIDIANENCGEYCYYIENPDVINGCGIKAWLYNTFSVGNTLLDCQNVRDRIVLENVPSGHFYLQTIVEAIKSNHVLKITYQKYDDDGERTFNVQPYCLKLFRQRWYLVANKISDMVKVYSLDRIKQISITDKKFEMPDDWNASVYFDGCYGIIISGENNNEIFPVKLKVSASQANYIRSLPLHESQNEDERNEEYSIFSYRLRETYDFEQEILRNGSGVEVLEPPILRNKIKRIITEMAKKYK